MRLLSIAILVLLAVSCSAFEKQTGEMVSVPAGSTVADDLLGSGNGVNVSGKVQGSALLAGNTVVVSGTVNEFLAAAGSMVTIRGAQKSVAAAGSNVMLESVTARNVMAAGSNVTLDEATTVARDVYVAGSNVAVRGKIGRNLGIAGANLSIGGQIGGDVDARGSAITVLPGTVIHGKLIWQGAKQPHISPDAKVMGKIIERTERPHKKPFSPIGRFVSFLAFFALGAAMLALFPDWTARAARLPLEKPGWSLLWGLIALVVVPVAAIIALITVIGIPIAIVTMVAYITAWLLTSVIAGLALGMLVLRGRSMYLELLVGLVILYVLGSIPFIGALTHLAVVLFAFGGMWSSLASGRATTVEPPGQ